MTAAVIEKNISGDDLNNTIRDLVLNRGHFVLDYCGRGWKHVSPYLPEIKVIKSTQPSSSIRKIVRICANTKIHEYKSRGIGDIAFVALYLNSMKLDGAGKIYNLNLFIFRLKLRGSVKKRERKLAKKEVEAPGSGIAMKRECKEAKK